MIGTISVYCILVWIWLLADADSYLPLHKQSQSSQHLHMRTLLSQLSGDERFVFNNSYVLAPLKFLHKGIRKDSDVCETLRMTSHLV